MCNIIIPLCRVPLYSFNIGISTAQIPPQATLKAMTSKNQLIFFTAAPPKLMSACSSVSRLSRSQYPVIWPIIFTLLAETKETGRIFGHSHGRALPPETGLLLSVWLWQREAAVVGHLVSCQSVSTPVLVGLDAWHMQEQDDLISENGCYDTLPYEIRNGLQ